MNLPKAVLHFILFQSLLMHSIAAQQDDYTLFRNAIVVLHQESQAMKPGWQAKYEAAKANVQVYEKGPSVTVLGGTPEENELVEQAVEESIRDVSVPPPPPQAEKVVTEKPIPPSPAPVQAKKENPPIDFTTQQMFPDEPSGIVMVPKAREPEPEPVEWVLMDEGITTETIINIDDIKDPVEKKKWQDYGELEHCILELNRIGLIGALHEESGSLSRFVAMQDELLKAGISLTDAFMQTRLAEPSKQLEVMKNSILGITTQILER